MTLSTRMQQTTKWVREQRMLGRKPLRRSFAISSIRLMEVPGFRATQTRRLVRYRWIRRESVGCGLVTTAKNMHGVLPTMNFTNGTTHLAIGSMLALQMKALFRPPPLLRQRSRQTMLEEAPQQSARSSFQPPVGALLERNSLAMWAQMYG